jgi:hypothetical protein
VRGAGQLLPEGAFFVRNFGGDLDLEDDKEFAALAAGLER